MKKILLILSLITLLPVITRAQSQIDQFQILQLGFNTSPGNPPSFTGYVYINNSGQLVCTLHNGTSCLSGGGGGTGTIIASPSPDCLPYYQGANTTLTADCALVTDTAGGLTLVKLTVSGATTGVITLKTGSAPANPASGYCSFYVDSGTNVLTGLNSSGGTCIPAAASPGGASTNVQFNNGAGGFGGDSTFLWDSSVHAGLAGSDGVSVPGTMTYLLPAESFSITNNFAVVGTYTGSGSAFIGQSPLAVQANINPSVADHTTFFAGANIVTQTPSAETADIGTMEGTYSESRYNGTGTIGANSGDFGLAGLDGEAFMESSAVLSNHGGARGVYGVFGYLGSGASPVGSGAGGEFQFEIGNGSSGSLGHAYGVAIDGPLNFGGTGTTTVAQYDALSVGCTVQGFITTQNCIIVTGAAPNNFGTGTSTFGGTIVNAVGSSSLPSYTFNANTNTGMYHSAANTIAWTASGTLGMELDLNWGLYLHDNDCIGFSTTTISLAKDTSLCRGAAGGVVAVGDAANSNAVNGTILAQDHATQLKATNALTAGQPVKADTGTASQVLVTATTDTAAGIVIGVVGNSPGAGGNAYVVTTGLLTTPLLGTGTCSIGNFVIVDTTTNGRVKCTGTYTAGTVIGVALTAQSSVGSAVSVMVGLR